MPEVYYDSTLTGQELDTALKKIPLIDAAVETAQKSAKTAESWAQGGTDTRKGENEDNAEYWAGQAKANAESTAADVKVVKDNEETIKFIGDNLETIQNAPAAAERAEAAVANAEAAATRAEASASAAADSADEAAQNAESVAESVTVITENKEAIQAVQENIDLIKNAPEAATRAETAATKAESDADRAETAAGKAAASHTAAAQSAQDAADSVQVITDNQEAIQAVQDNLDAVKGAADNALRAEAAADSAAGDADRAEKAADQAQSIAQGALGYYAKASDLQAAHETGQNGQWAIVGDTDTIWVWDSDTQSWTDSGNKTDLSQYYTKDEADAELDEVQKTLGQQITDAKNAAQAAASRSWVLAVAADEWQQQEDGSYTKSIPAEGMTEQTKLSASIGAKPGSAVTLEEKKARQQALGCISEMESGDGAVTLTCYEQAPSTDVELEIWEVR